MRETSSLIFGLGDLVRLPLLLEYGGVWLDAGMILFRHLDDICWKKIEDPESPYELAGFLLASYKDDDLAMANGFIAAKAHNPFLQRVHQVYRALWNDGAVNQDGFHIHPLLRHLGTMHAPNKVRDDARGKSLIATCTNNIMIRMSQSHSQI